MAKNSIHPNRSNRHEHGGRHGMRNLIAAGAAVTLLAAGTYKYLESQDANAVNAPERKYIETLVKGEAKPDVVNRLIVIGAGVNIRKSPIIINPDKGSNADSHLKTVEDGTKVVADLAVSYTDENGDKWYGIKLDAKAKASNAETSKTPDKPLSISEIASKYAWVNVSALKGQVDSQGNPLIAEYAIQTEDSRIVGHDTVPGAIDASGNIHTNSGQIEVGVARTMTDGYWQFVRDSLFLPQVSVDK